MTANWNKFKLKYYNYLNQTKSKTELKMYSNYLEIIKKQKNDNHIKWLKWNQNENIKNASLITVYKY